MIARQVQQSLTLQQQVEQDTHAWAAKGHKANRARQRRMMLAFAAHAQALGARDRGQVGDRTVTSYWKALRAAGRAHATQMDHWRALRELWEIWGKPGEPPRPLAVVAGAARNSRFSSDEHAPG